MSRAGGLGAKAMDDEGRSMLYDGCSKSQLGTLFGIDKRDIDEKIRDVPPSGERMGYPIWRIKDVAPYLVPPQGNFEEAIKKMSPKDLPPMLTKEFWQAQHSRLKFEEDQGDLWRTADVIEKLSVVFKTLRMNLLLVNDQVERQTQLTEKQRKIIQGLIDSTLNQLADSLINAFKDEPARRHDSGWTEPAEADPAEGL